MNQQEKYSYYPAIRKAKSEPEKFHLGFHVAIGLGETSSGRREKYKWLLWQHKMAADMQKNGAELQG